MLQNIRDKSQGWLSTVIISLVCFTFVIWGVHTYSNGGQSETAVKINGSPITRAQVNAAYERLRQQQQVQLGADYSINHEVEQQLKNQSIHQLVTAEVLTQAALEEGLRFTNEQLSTLMKTVPAFQVNGQFSPTRFKEVLDSLWYTPAAFLSDMRSAMLINEVRVGLSNSAFALPTEISRAMQLIDQRRDIAYWQMSYKPLVKKVVLSPQTVQAYYDQHSSEFQLPEQVKLEYLELSIPLLKKQYPHESQEKIDQRFAEASDRLADLSYTHPKSLADASKSLGLPVQKTEWFGRIHPASKNQVIAAPKVQEAAFSNDVLVTGNNSRLIELAPNHVVVLRMGEHKPASVMPLSSVKATIEARLKTQKAQEKIKEMGDTWVATFQQRSPVYNEQWIKQNKISRYDLKVNPSILNAAFHMPKPKTNNATFLGYQLPSGDYVVIALRGVYEAATSDKRNVQNRVFQEQIEHSYGQLDYELYVRSLFRKAKIDMIKNAS